VVKRVSASVLRRDTCVEWSPKARARASSCLRENRCHARPFYCQDANRLLRVRCSSVGADRFSGALYLTWG